jgi:hypothetical protein
MRFAIGFVLTVAVLLDVTSTTVVAAEASTSNGPSWLLMHSWDGNRYTSRGTLEIVAGSEGSDKPGEILKIKNDAKATMSPQDVTNMLNYGWYHIMLFSATVANLDEHEEPVAIATVPACHLRRANFRDEFMFVVGSDDAIVSMSYAPLISPLAPKTCDMESLALMRSIDEEKGVAFDSKVSDVSTYVPGMVLKAVLPQSKPPPGILFLPNPNRQRSANNNKAGSSSAGAGPGTEGGEEGGEPETPPGPFDFIKRYWYVFVPLLIMNFVTSESPAADPMATAAAEGGSSGAATAGAASTGGGGGDGSPSKRSARRGKQNK